MNEFGSGSSVFYPFLIIRWFVGFCLFVCEGFLVGFVCVVVLVVFFPRIHYSHGL